MDHLLSKRFQKGLFVLNSGVREELLRKLFFSNPYIVVSRTNSSFEISNGTIATSATATTTNTTMSPPLQPHIVTGFPQETVSGANQQGGRVGRIATLWRRTRTQERQKRQTRSSGGRKRNQKHSICVFLAKSKNRSVNRAGRGGTSLNVLNT